MVLFLQGEPAPILQGFFKLRVASVPGRLAFYDESGDEFLLHWKSRSIKLEICGIDTRPLFIILKIRRDIV